MVNTFQLFWNKLLVLVPSNCFVFCFLFFFFWGGGGGGRGWGIPRINLYRQHIPGTCSLFYPDLHIGKLKDPDSHFCDVLVSFSDRNQCGSKLYGLRPLIACLPAWWRFAQSLRRYDDTKQKFPHLANAGKYATTFFVVFFSTVATTHKGITAKVE